MEIRSSSHDGVRPQAAFSALRPVTFLPLRDTFEVLGLLAGRGSAPDVGAVETLMRRLGLTRRQARVAALLADRRSNNEIAHELGISSHTARHHTERVLGTLGIHSRLEVGPTLVARLQKVLARVRWVCSTIGPILAACWPDLLAS